MAGLNTQKLQAHLGIKPGQKVSLGSLMKGKRGKAKPNSYATKDTRAGC